jgi:hypothetical protein
VLHRTLTIVKLLYDEWGGLNEQQVSELLVKIPFAFPRLQDPVACFCIAEILGDRLVDARALQILFNFSTIDDPSKRGLAAYGLGLWASNANNPTECRMAVCRLLELANDPIKEVRAEAKGALRRARAEA